jgi:hypothetical protein
VAVGLPEIVVLLATVALYVAIPVAVIVVVLRVTGFRRTR